MATDTRFIKVDGAFQRPPVTSYMMGTVDVGGNAPTNLPGFTPGTTQPSGGGGQLPTTPSAGGTGQMTGAQNSGTTPLPENPMDNLNNFMMGLIKSAQGIDAQGLTDRKLSLQKANLDLMREQNARMGQSLGGDLSHLSPAQQSSIRNGSIDALGPEMDINKYEIAKAEASLNNYTKLIDQIKNYSTDLYEKSMAPQSVIDNAVSLIESDPTRMGVVLSGLNDKTQQKVIESLNPSKISKKSDDLSNTPTSYKEWALAGQPGTYADWIKESNVKAPTIAQQTVAEYAARIEQANPTISRLESDVNKMNMLNFNAQVALPATFQSNTMQQYMQSARNFINAKLRRESGAVISPEEFTEARLQYLPQPGDTKDTLIQKKSNRDLVYASLKSAAGPAYQSVEQLLGPEAEAPAQGGQTYGGGGSQNASGGFTGVTKSGLKYKIVQ